jgi:hypothetical protein
MGQIIFFVVVVALGIAILISRPLFLALKKKESPHAGLISGIVFILVFVAFFFIVLFFIASILMVGGV